MNKKAFSFVELIISITILVLLAIIWTAATNNIKNNSNNSRVIADLNTIKNSLVSYSSEWNILPKPQWNRNYFKSDWSYIHDFEDDETFWWYGKITENTLENRYLNTIPLDPRTNQYYSYWIAKESNEFEIAWVIYNDWEYLAKVEWNYRALSWIFSLIREYNWSNYVIDKSYNLPYNPYERTLIARTSDWSIYEEWDTIVNNSLTDLEIYFSDWSISIITPGTTIKLNKLDFPKENNLVSNVLLFLESGTIWTQATRLWEESTFDIFTTDTTASVRWTIFRVSKEVSSINTEVTVLEWSVEVKKINKPKPLALDIIDIKQLYELAVMPLTVEVDKENYDFHTVQYEDNSIYKEEKKIEESALEIPVFPKLSLTNKVEDNQLSFNEVVNIETWNKSCYLEWFEVKNWEKRSWFKERFVEKPIVCSTPKDRICDNWVFTDWHNDYKYVNCVEKEAWQCAPYGEDWFSWSSAVNKWDTTNTTKSVNINLWWVKVWERIITRTLECVDGINYDQIWLDSDTISCISPYTQVWDSCSCPANYDLHWWTCYENPFGPDYVLVKVVPTISWSYYWLNTSNLWVDLWSNFWLVFDIDWLISSSSRKEFLYDYTWWKKDIVFTRINKLFISKDWIDTGSNYNIIKESSGSNYKSNTLKLKFEWINWEDKWENIYNNNSWILKWVTVDLEGKNLKLINVSNIRIYNKDTSWTWWVPLGGAPSWWEPIASWWISVSWKWCSSCPSGSIKKWSWCWHYRVCDWVIWSNVCAEKSWCFRGDESWSWTYYP